MPDPTIDPAATYSAFWEQFHLFPSRWMNALLRPRRNLYLLFIVSYAVFLGPDLSAMLFDQPTAGAPWQAALARLPTHILALGILIAFWVYQRWAAGIPAFFEWLRQPPRRLQPLAGGEPDDIKFDAAYLEYLQRYQHNLASRTGSTLASLSLFSVVVVLYILAARANGSSWMLVFFLLWSYLIGLAAWPMMVTVQALRLLTRRFQVVLQPSHPDRCGGLEPLGQFCFAMSLPVVLGIIDLLVVGLGGLSLLYNGASQRLADDLGLAIYSDSAIYAYLVGSLVIVVVFGVPLVAVTFFVPVWNIHRYMEACKRQAQDDFAARVARYEQVIRAELDAPQGLEAARTARDRLAITLEALDPNKNGYPVWPFRPTAVIALFSPQIISAAGFVMSILQNIGR